MILKDIYINGISAISIQAPLSAEGLQAPESYHGPHVRCQEPNFRDYFDPIASRRMSRIIKRAIVTAKNAVTEAGIEKPDAIITGTGLGCVEDTEKFLDAMIRNEEKFLQPAFFIQSTHNTISSQIAINLHCNGYNNTYIHRGVSFENALVDASLLFNEGQIHSAMVTGNDEMTPNYFILLKRIGYWKDAVEETLRIIDDGKGNGSFAGEGSTSFVFANSKSPSTYTQFRGMDLFYKPTEPVSQRISKFLADFSLSASDIDVVMTGMNGGKDNDDIYHHVTGNLFKPDQIGIYKQLCGEYYTSSAFGLWASAWCLREGKVPAHLMKSGNAKEGIKHILFYNHFQNRDHSLILLSCCD
jgi:3-oxoacyl-[acyl-carrier-protein] synthase II